MRAATISRFGGPEAIEVVEQPVPAPGSGPSLLRRPSTSLSPLNAPVAGRALTLCDLQPGQSLLVTGAAGGVGGYAVELAAIRGIRALTTASPVDESLVRHLGATDFIPRGADLPGEIRRLVGGRVDAVIDAARLGITAHNALRGGGTFVTFVRPFAPPPIRGTRVLAAEACANGTRRTELVVASGR